MSEVLGGSRGRRDNNANKFLDNTKGFLNSRSSSNTRSSFSGLNGPSNLRPTSAGGNPIGYAVPMGHKGRPSSAPRLTNLGPGEKAFVTKARVEERRRQNEAQFWGREDQEKFKPPKRDLPAFWSVDTHGQPFNDERLASGAANFYRLLTPQSVNDGERGSVGPATAHQAALRKSLELGKRLVQPDLSPLPPDVISSQNDLRRVPDLQPEEREFLLAKLTPYQRIHALNANLDQQMLTSDRRIHPDFYPWPLLILNREFLATRMDRNAKRQAKEKYAVTDWFENDAQRDLLLRFGTNELLFIMNRHLRYMSDVAAARARAPAEPPKHILRRAFLKVDPARTGLVSIYQLIQVWQNILSLFDYQDVWVKQRTATGKSKWKNVLRPLRRFLINRNMAAAIFIRNGFDKEGLMPYMVFVNTLCESPARLMGHELFLDKRVLGKNGLENDVDVASCMGNCKIDYRYCNKSVFPPGDFHPHQGMRSFFLPKAHMWLEHVYGYNGFSNMANNLYYTHNTGRPVSNATLPRLEAKHGVPVSQFTEDMLKSVEIVYYTGCLGVVFNKELFDLGEPSQRFFFGHSNDVQCLAIHPNRQWVATGQQKQVGDREVPYVCIWDVDTCMQLQRLDHLRTERSVIAVQFSGDALRGKGGSLLVTVTADDQHSVHLWRWLPHQDKYVNAHYIPGWSFGPEKKVRDLTQNGNAFFKDPLMGQFPFNIDSFEQRHPEDYEAVQALLRASRVPLDLNDLDAFWNANGWWDKPQVEAGQDDGPDPMWTHFDRSEVRILPGDVDGFYVNMRAVRAEWNRSPAPGMPPEQLRCPFMEASFPGTNGTPPMVYGIAWNPFKPSTGARGSEFAIYGVKHLKVFIVDDNGQWRGRSGSFGTEHIDNVLSAIYVPAMHAMKAPGDVCIVTGFANGNLGLWVPPYPTRPGAVYALSRIFSAHDPGPMITLNDGSQSFGGVRALVLRVASSEDKGGGGGSGNNYGNNNSDNKSNSKGNNNSNNNNNSSSNTSTKNTVKYQVLSGGGDGCVRVWDLEAPSDPITSSSSSPSANRQSSNATSYKSNPASTVSSSLTKGASLRKAMIQDPQVGQREAVYHLQAPGTSTALSDDAVITSMDSHPALKDEFAAGTTHCDIWEVDADPRVLVEGFEDEVRKVAPHPENPFVFATVSKSGSICVFDGLVRNAVRKADLGFPLVAVAYSNDPFDAANPLVALRLDEVGQGVGLQSGGGGGGGGEFGGTGKGAGAGTHTSNNNYAMASSFYNNNGQNNNNNNFYNNNNNQNNNYSSTPTTTSTSVFTSSLPDENMYHLAVSGPEGQILILDSVTLRPLVKRNDIPSRQAVTDLKYSPPGGPRQLAAGTSDLAIYVYRADRGYQLLSKCVGHSGTVEHVDWTLPASFPGLPYDGNFMIQSSDAAHDLLNWDPSSGKKLPFPLKDAEFYTVTTNLGFDLMGIWADGSDGTDVNATSRARRGVPVFDPFEAAAEGSPDAAMHLPGPEESADNVAGAGYTVTADDFSFVKLFNYPVCTDDAPYKVFRGHSSHVCGISFLADDRLCVSTGSLDRGVFQWRTCGVANGLPPVPTILKKLSAAFPYGDAAREKVWMNLRRRAAEFRNYERIRLLAMRVAAEEKRVNCAGVRESMAAPKLKDHLEWGPLDSSGKQFGPIPKQQTIKILQATLGEQGANQ